MAALKMEAIETSWGMISKLPRSTSPKWSQALNLGLETAENIAIALNSHNAKSHNERTMRS